MNLNVNRALATHLDLIASVIRIQNIKARAPACMPQWNKPASSSCIGIMRRCISTIALWRRPSEVDAYIRASQANSWRGACLKKPPNAYIYSAMRRGNRVIRSTSDSQTQHYRFASSVSRLSYLRTTAISRAAIAIFARETSRRGMCQVLENLQVFSNVEGNINKSR